VGILAKLMRKVDGKLQTTLDVKHAGFKADF